MATSSIRYYESIGLLPKPDRLSSRKLEEVEALLARTRAMKSWLEVAQNCACPTPDACALFAAPGDEPVDTNLPLTVVHVKAGDCRRTPA